MTISLYTKTYHIFRILTRVCFSALLFGLLRIFTPTRPRRPRYPRRRDRDHPREAAVRLHLVRVHVRVREAREREERHGADLREREERHGADLHALVGLDEHAGAKDEQAHGDVLEVVHDDAFPAVLGLAGAHEALVLGVFLRGHGAVGLLDAREALGERQLHVLGRPVARRERLAALDGHRERHLDVQHARAERQHLGAERHDHLSFLLTVGLSSGVCGKAVVARNSGSSSTSGQPLK